MYRLSRARANAVKTGAFSALRESNRDFIAIVSVGDRTCGSTAGILPHFHLGLVRDFVPDRDILPDETGEGLRRTADGLHRVGPTSRVCRRRCRCAGLLSPVFGFQVAFRSAVPG